MIRVVGAAVLLLLQGPPDDPPALSAVIDGAVRGISGYNQVREGRPVSDEVFLKRILKDLAGDVPAEAELKAFAADPDAHKRSKKINQLLEDDRFSAFWAGRFVRVFFGDPESVRFQGLGELGPGVEVGLLPAFTTSLAVKIKKDTPWTEIVTQLLDARGTTDGDPALPYKLSFYRGLGMPEEFAEGVSRHFLGIRIGCARCHDHPYDVWTTAQYYGMAAFIFRQRAERVGGVPQVKYADDGELMIPKRAAIGPKPGVAAPPTFLFGGTAGKNDDRMKMLAFFMTQKGTTQLPRALANRIWGWIFGRGVVHPVDAISGSNRALSTGLLEAMTRDLIDNGYSIKRLVRAICNSQSYQLPGPEELPEAESFRHVALRKAAAPFMAVDKPALPLGMEVPAGWVRVKATDGAKGKFLIPDKADPSRFVEVQVFVGKPDKSQLELMARQMDPRQETSVKIEGKMPVVLTEYTGTFWCTKGGDGGVESRLMLATLEGGEKGFHIKVLGPADRMASCRDEVVALLRTATPR